MRLKFKGKKAAGRTARGVPRRAARAAARILLAEAVVLAPLAVFARLLAAEGPLALLFIWAGVVALLIALSPAAKVRTAVPKASAAAAALAILAGMAGALAILAQVSVARRSLAEAWLALAREGKAFGFFSFFAAEIYALFLIACCILLVRRKYAAYAAAFAASASLCAGIISGKTIILAPAALLSLAFLFFSGTGSHGSSTRAKSVFFPAVTAVMLAAIISASPAPGVWMRKTFSAPDLTAAFSRIAPSFPLIRDIPGYGLSARAADMPASLYLSDRTLFSARGEPESVHYLVSETYRDWNGQRWAVEPENGDSIPVVKNGGEETNDEHSLELTLVEDFTPSVPVEGDTARVAVTDDAPEKAMAFRNRGVRFEPSVRRGCRIRLTGAPAAHVESDGAERAALSGGGSADSPKIAALARALGATTLGNRAYLAAILDYLSTGYEYSLKTGMPESSADPVETFLFSGKKGFCLYFASAFVLLARQGGLPARLREGYRVTIDPFGQGVVSGNNAHAWAEVFIDGDWRIFEATPPYRFQDPFAWTARGDGDTARQLSALFGPETAQKEPGRASLAPLTADFFRRQRGAAAAGIAAAAATIAGLAFIFGSGESGHRRRARKLVRRYRKKGVAGPEVTGWTVWKAAARKAARSPAAAAEAESAAERMIRAAFAPARRDTLS